ncbi:hypothetical protein H8M03_10700 [Sphingomonas sabuli]|uniref:Uncharacterized protein n=1 Tax=Sphingomonas sabuli TaxID=2764186 RepID=A0A7G9L1G7_9SPHN|nr:hypothetical protein [Sphingomonas sabuli]QNM82466.1 hypothetical protein H8M03_10700 [Sphingomonas sabuli]
MTGWFGQRTISRIGSISHLARAGRVTLLAGLMLLLTSCQPPARDIIVNWHNGRLLVDFPWSLWRLVGLQNRNYCFSQVELFDQSQVLWMLKQDEKGPVWHSCFDVQMPFAIGVPLEKFTAAGIARLQRGKVYGIDIRGIGRERVDFMLRTGSKIAIERDWERVIDPPCKQLQSECSAPRDMPWKRPPWRENLMPPEGPASRRPSP